VKNVVDQVMSHKSSFCNERIPCWPTCNEPKDPNISGDMIAKTERTQPWNFDWRRINFDVLHHERG